jgi:hypothetical protein
MKVSRDKIKKEQRKRFDALQRKHIGEIYKALRVPLDNVIANIKRYGVGYAYREIDFFLANENLIPVIENMYVDTGVTFAKITQKQIKQAASQKAAFPTGNLGDNQEWVNSILSYFRTKLLTAAVLPITETQKSRVRKFLSKAINEGWGIEETLRRIEQNSDDNPFSEKLTRGRSLVIARTEIVRASFVGQNIAAEEAEFVCQKEWLSVSDDRVRDAHDEIDGTVIDMDEYFIVDGERMQGPGDSRASARNLCNCRCSLSIIPKRDKRGNLILKK